MADFISLNGYNVKDKIARTKEVLMGSPDFEFILRDYHHSTSNLATTDPATICLPQGMCYTKNNNVMVTYHNGYDDNCYLVEYNTYTKTIVRTSSVMDLGHANWLAFDEETNQIFVSPSTHRINGEITGPYLEVIVLDYDTLQIVGRRPTPIRFLSLTKDAVTGKWYACDESAVYLVNDILTMSTALLFQIENTYDTTGQTPQGIIAYDDIIYELIAWPSNIRIFNLEGELIRKVSLDDYYGLYQVGEAEALAIDSDANLYLLGSVRGVTRTYVSAPIFKTNLVTGSNLGHGQFKRENRELNINVNNTTKVLDPRGTEEKPFNTLLDVEQFLNNPYFVTNNIRLKSGCDFRQDMLYLVGYNKQLTRYGGDDEVTVGSLIIRSAGAISSSNISYDNSLLSYAYGIDCANVALFNMSSGTINCPINFGFSDLLLSSTVVLGSGYDRSASNFTGYSNAEWVMPGASFTGLIGFGMFTAGQKEVYIDLPLSKKITRLIKNNEATLSGTITVRGTGGYILNRTDISTLTVQSVNMNYEQNIVECRLTLPSAVTTSTNNSPVWVQLFGTLTFTR